jgi:hypothetical protein
MWATKEATLMIDDVSPHCLRGRLHRRNRVLAAQQHTEHVDVHRLLVRADRCRHRVVVVAQHDAGVVVQHVQPAEGLHRVLNSGLHGLLVGDVATHETGLAARAAIASTASSPSDRSAITTWAPSAANNSAPTRPRPDAAPVTRATFPARRFMAAYGSARPKQETE